MTERAMNALFTTRCAVCGVKIPQGAPMLYDKVRAKGDRARHQACVRPEQGAQPSPLAKAAPAAAVQAGQPTRNGSPASRFPTFGAVHQYASMADFMDATVNPANKTEAWRGWSSGDHAPGADWYGLAEEFPGRNTPTAAQVAALVGAGWTRGARRIEEALAGFTTNAKPRSMRRVRARADVGAEVDVTEYWRGRGDVAWTKCVRQVRPGRNVVTIVNDAIESGGNDADRMFWRGAAVVALADALTTAGYNVEVVSAWCASDYGGVACYVVCKPATAPMDIQTLAGAVANPAFFRCLGHAWGNAHETNKRGHDYAHGYRVDAWPTHPSEILASNQAQWNADTARAWVEKQIALIEAPMAQAA